FLRSIYPNYKGGDFNLAAFYCINCAERHIVVITKNHFNIQISGVGGFFKTQENTYSSIAILSDT
ncbi:MAG TPA: hypothetical protein DEB10_13920, partial [Ruminococcaceae bacterium]|nr:hypothetical protein [Oscillospiraceae bacterium]